MQTDFWNNFWMVIVGLLSIVTSIVAIYIASKANMQVEKQIEINNKQFLFTKRIEILKACRTLFNAFGSYQMYKDGDYNFLLEADKLVKLTDNEVIGIKIDLLKNIGVENTKKHLENLFRIPQKLSTELSFVFDNIQIGALQSFLHDYSTFLIKVSYYRDGTSTQDVKEEFNRLNESWEKMQDSGILASLEKDTRIFYKNK